MKSILVTSSLLALAVASPLANPHQGHSYEKDYKGHEGRPYRPDKVEPPKVFDFTSTYNIIATPDQVVNATNAFTGGLKGAKGYFNYGINSHLNTICYNITLVGVTGDYSSPAKTATHIHQGDKGKAGPPRVAIPNPLITGEKNVEGKEIRRSVGCLVAPFVTGVNVAGTTTDSGSASGFTVAMIEKNPANFFTDTHVVAAVAGAVRGQFY